MDTVPKNHSKLLPMMHVEKTDTDTCFLCSQLFIWRNKRKHSVVRQ